VTIIDTGAHIAAFLLGAAAVAAFIAALVRLRRRGYQGPAPEPYAGFREAAHTGVEFLELECQGHCPGATAHETAGDEATCVLCGTTRRIPEPDAA
jgi:hypothetical protein